jgi:hypothetical protein
MAALALPILALGGIYIYCNSNKKKEEAYTNLNRLNALTNTNVPDINYPTESVTISSKNENSVRQYNGQGQSTDVFFNNS